jgi:DNA-binding CsgD family transcriptional regulator
MEQTVTRVGGDVVGREPELAALAGFLAAESPATLVLSGEAGAGKTTLWEAGTDLARQRGLRVLVARPGEAETSLSFGGLADLCDAVDIGELDVPAPQRRALETAILRAEPSPTSAEPFAVPAGLLSTLRALADQHPLLIAVDDVPWLDRPSAEALVYAARRLRGYPVRFLLARRNGPSTDLEQALESAGIGLLEIGPVSLGAGRRILLARLGLNLPIRVVRQIHETSRGNPLFLLELGRMLLGREPPQIGEQIPVPDRIEDLLGTRIEGLSPPVRRVLLALALSSDLHVAQLAAIADAGTLDEAIDAGLVLVDADRVRPSHPLLTSAAVAGSKPSEQRALHLELARVAADRRLRVRHLALATPQPDAALAAEVAAAAADAAQRGAAVEAALLAEHALRLTPPASSERPGRLLAFAGYLIVAGERQRVTDLLSPELESLPGGELRVRGYLLMPGGAITGNDEVLRYLELALAASSADPRLHAAVRVELAINQLITQVARIPEAEAWLLEALPASRRTGPDPYCDLLYGLAWARALRGRPIDRLCRRFRAASPAERYMVGSTDRIAGQRLVWRGEVVRARPLLTDLLSLAEERGEPASRGLHRLHVCELELRVGAWSAAELLLDDWADPSERAVLPWPMYERCRALLAAGRGLPDEARRWASEAIVQAEATGVRWDWLEASRAVGVAGLFAGDLERAAHDLGAVWEYTRREGIDDPGAFPAAGDLVEALVGLDRLAEAKTVACRLRTLSSEQRHPWGLVTALRSEALCRLAGARDEAALGELAEAADAYGRLDLRFDRARTLLALGRAERRLRKWGAARRSLEAAAEAFTEIGSEGWSELTRSELARVSGRRPRAEGALTPSEERIAALAAEGMSNKEIAASLFVTVQTVEAHLTHAYAKLGVHSRGQLARRLSTRA